MRNPMGSDGGGGGAGVVATVGGTVTDVAGGGVTTGARVEAVVATPPMTIVDDAFETVGATTVVFDAVFVTVVDVIVDATVDDVVGLDDVMVSVDVESSLCTATLPSTSTATTSLDAEPHAPSAVATTSQCHFTTRRLRRSLGETTQL